MEARRRSDLLLAAGMALGAVVAGFSLVSGSPTAGGQLAGDSVAVVGGEPISREAFATAVGLVARDRRSTVDAGERRQILDRLIDEELLFQHAMALDLARSDRRVRSELVSAVIDAATASAAEAEPSEDELHRFFEENRVLFDGAAPLRVAQVFVSSSVRGDAAAAERAAHAVERLRAGEDIAVVRRDLGDPPAVEIPASLQPADRLRDSIGPSAAAAALALRVGEVSEPERGPDGYRVLVLLERGESAGPGFEGSRDRIVGEWRRRLAEQSLHDFLAGLRSAADVSVDANAVAGVP